MPLYASHLYVSFMVIVWPVLSSGLQLVRILHHSFIQFVESHMVKEVLHNYKPVFMECANGNFEVLRRQFASFDL